MKMSAKKLVRYVTQALILDTSICHEQEQSIVMFPGSTRLLLIGGDGTAARTTYEFLSIPEDPSCPASVANSSSEVKWASGAVVDGEILMCEGGEKS